MPVKYFIDVVQTHGFISAAKRNYVSETAVSSAIKKLEAELGQKLLNRSNGELSLTPVGAEFYRRSVEIINLYNEIWNHPDPHPEKLLRIHFFQGLENEAAELANKLPSDCQISFDEENFDTGIIRLLNSNYDLLIGFQLAFQDNNKVLSLPLAKVGFDLLFNQEEVTQFHTNLLELAKNSMFYMQNWKSTGIEDIQSAMLKSYQQENWTYGQIAKVNSFAAACLNVNFKGGVTMVPESFEVPSFCQNIYRISPEHMQDAFEVDVALNPAASGEFRSMVKHVTTLIYRQ